MINETAVILTGQVKSRFVAKNHFTKLFLRQVYIGTPFIDTTSTTIS
jgi:hypothetical protein